LKTFIKTISNTENSRHQDVPFKIQDFGDLKLNVVILVKIQGPLATPTVIGHQLLMQHWTNMYNYYPTYRKYHASKKRNE